MKNWWENCLDGDIFCHRTGTFGPPIAWGEYLGGLDDTGTRHVDQYAGSGRVASQAWKYEFYPVDKLIEKDIRIMRLVLRPGIQGWQGAEFYPGNDPFFCAGLLEEMEARAAAPVGPLGGNYRAGYIAGFFGLSLVARVFDGPGQRWARRMLAGENPIARAWKRLGGQHRDVCSTAVAEESQKALERAYHQAFDINPAAGPEQDRPADYDKSPLLVIVKDYGQVFPAA